MKGILVPKPRAHDAPRWHELASHRGRAHASPPLQIVHLTAEYGGADVSPQQRADERPAPRALLLCGILSSMVYVAMDVVGGLSYPGYSFASQAISELGAIGAPSRNIVAWIAVVYNVLVLGFAIGVVRVAAGNRVLRNAGTALLIYGAVGVVTSALVSTFFSMQRRGTGDIHRDLPHLVLTGVLVLCLLLAIGMGALGFGKRFRAYSVATFMTAIAFGAASGGYGARLAAGKPTRGLGIVERIDVYSSLLWIAVLAVALLRRESRSGLPSEGHDSSKSSPDSRSASTQP